MASAEARRGARVVGQPTRQTRTGRQTTSVANTNSAPGTTPLRDTTAPAVPPNNALTSSSIKTTKPRPAATSRNQVTKLPPRRAANTTSSPQAQRTRPSPFQKALSAVGIRRRNKKKATAKNIVSNVLRRLRVITLLSAVFWIYLPAYGLQIAFGIVYLGIDEVIILGTLIDSIGTLVFGLSTKEIAHMLIIAIGIIAMFSTIIACIVMRIRLDSPLVIIGAAVAFAGYVAPGLFLLPWVLIWLGLVFLAQ